MKYLSRLAGAIVRHGGKIFTDTHATKFSGGPDARVETASGAAVSCKAIVLVTNAPINDRLAGSFGYICTFHPMMMGEIVVEESRGG